MMCYYLNVPFQGQRVKQTSVFLINHHHIWEKGNGYNTGSEHLGRNMFPSVTPSNCSVFRSKLKKINTLISILVNTHEITASVSLYFELTLQCNDRYKFRHDNGLGHRWLGSGISWTCIALSHRATAVHRTYPFCSPSTYIHRQQVIFFPPEHSLNYSYTELNFLTNQRHSRKTLPHFCKYIHTNHKTVHNQNYFPEHFCQYSIYTRTHIHTTNGLVVRGAV